MINKPLQISVDGEVLDLISDGEVLDLVYERVIKILEEVDEYMTNPKQRYSTDEYNMMFVRMEVCNEVMKVLKNNEDYEYVDHAINKYDKEEV